MVPRGHECDDEGRASRRQKHPPRERYAIREVFEPALHGQIGGRRSHDDADRHQGGELPRDEEYDVMERRTKDLANAYLFRTAPDGKGGLAEESQAGW